MSRLTFFSALDILVRERLTTGTNPYFQGGNLVRLSVGWFRAAGSPDDKLFHLDTVKRIIS
jgi:hypothetical protein